MSRLALLGRVVVHRLARLATVHYAASDVLNPGATGALTNVKTAVLFKRRAALLEVRAVLLRTDKAADDEHASSDLICQPRFLSPSHPSRSDTPTHPNQDRRHLAVLWHARRAPDPLPRDGFDLRAGG